MDRTVVMSAEQDEVRGGRVTAPAGAVQAGPDAVLAVIVGVPIPVGLDPDWMREALRESVARAGSAAAAAAYAILATYYRQMDGRSDD